MWRPCELEVDERELFWEAECDEECEEHHRLESVADVDTIDNRTSFPDSIPTLMHPLAQALVVWVEEPAYRHSWL